MTVQLNENVISALATAPLPVQKAFIKQIAFLSRNLQHPSLHAKRYDESQGLWQARVNDDWRFYFVVEGSRYIIEDLIPHPK